MPDVKVKSEVGRDDYQIIITIGRGEIMGGNLNITEALQKGAEKLADKYIAEHQQMILENISPAAVSNLAIAESAKLVRQSFIDPQPKEEK